MGAASSIALIVSMTISKTFVWTASVALAVGIMPPLRTQQNRFRVPTIPASQTCNFCHGMLYSASCPSFSIAAAALAALAALPPRSLGGTGSREQFCSSLGRVGALDSTKMPLVPFTQDSASISQSSSLSIAKLSSASFHAFRFQPKVGTGPSQSHQVNRDRASEHKEVCRTCREFSLSASPVHVEASDQSAYQPLSRSFLAEVGFALFTTPTLRVQEPRTVKAYATQESWVSKCREHPRSKNATSSTRDPPPCRHTKKRVKTTPLNPRRT